MSILQTERFHVWLANARNRRSDGFSRRFEKRDEGFSTAGSDDGVIVASNSGRLLSGGEIAELNVPVSKSSEIDSAPALAACMRRCKRISLLAWIIACNWG